MRFVQLSARGTICDLVSDSAGVASRIADDDDLRAIMTAVAVCHSVIISADGYSSESPDEEALVQTAAEVGAKFVARVPDRSSVIEIAGEEINFEYLATVDFDSDRKRMSVILRDPHGQVIVHTKGADTVMRSLFADSEASVAETIQEEVDGWAEQGLRTLLCGYRVVPEEE